MNRLLLHRVDPEHVELLVEHLTQVHHDALVNLLPQMGSEDLDERDLQRRDLTVHEDPGQIELHLETHVHLKQSSVKRKTSSNCRSRIRLG